MSGYGIPITKSPPGSPEQYMTRGQAAEPTDYNRRRISSNEQAQTHYSDFAEAPPSYYSTTVPCRLFLLIFFTSQYNMIGTSCT